MAQDVRFPEPGGQAPNRGRAPDLVAFQVAAGILNTIFVWEGDLSTIVIFRRGWCSENGEIIEI